jgi:hypothetical protein
MRAIDIKNAFEPHQSIKSDSFTVILLRLIAKSDSVNREKLAAGYPAEVEAVRIFKTECPYVPGSGIGYTPSSEPECYKTPDYDQINKMAHEFAEKQLGATGEFPEGKITEDDEGALLIGVGNDVESKTVIVNFGKAVAWLGLDKASALQIADSIRDHAMELP